MGIRRKARQFALQCLYAVDMCHIASIATALPVVDWQLYEEMMSINEQALPKNELKKEFCSFVEKLVQGVYEHQAKIDEMISRCSHHWKISRMPIVDRNVLRVAVFEMLFCPDVPVTVAINEAVEIAKLFGSEDSGAFVNGILDRVGHELRVAKKAS